MNRLKRLLHRSPVTLPSQDAYALWAANYPPTAHNALMQIEQAAMLSLMPSLAGRDVLDLACGSGRYSLIARAAGARRVVGLDNSVPMLIAGRGSESGAAKLQADMDALPLRADSWDVVICALAAGHLPPDRMRVAIHEIGRVLRADGVALITDFHPFMFLSGGRRTFTAPDGVQYAVEHYPHLVSDYFDAIQAVGLTFDALAEPKTTLPDGTSAPAVLVLRVRRSE